MAVDWGSVFDAAIDVWQGQKPGGPMNGAGLYTPPGFAPQPPFSPAPAKVTVDTRTGKVTKCSRRRRRRLLTSTDINDLAALKAIVGGGQAMNLAVAKAVRR